MSRLPSVSPGILSIALLLAGASAVLALDSDGDGLDDSFDNCRDLPNPEQTDSDGDGLGNRCDGDYDQSGVVDGHDVPLFTHLELGKDPAADLDGNGVVDREDRRIMMRELLHDPPGPGADPEDDGDDLPLALDACPASEIGSHLLRGCSALDLSLRAREVIARPALELLEAVVDGFIGSPEYDLFLGSLQLAQSHLSEAAGQAAQGDPCTAALTARRSSDVLALAEAELDERLAETLVELVRSSTPPSADELESTELEDAMLPFDFLRSRFERAAAASSQAAGEIQTLCDTSTGPLLLQDAVESLDGERRIARLASGTILGLAEGYVLEPDANGAEWELAPGLAFEAEAIGFPDGTRITPRLRPAQTFPPPPQLEEIDCVELEVRPLQLAPEYTGAPWILHDATSYQLADDGLLLLEHGAGLGIATTCAEEPVDGYLADYGARITVNNSRGSITLANFLGDGESVPLPWVPLGERFDIVVTPRKRECAISPPHGCREAVGSTSRTWRATIFPQGAFCRAEYAETQFDVETTGQFRHTWVTGVNLVGGPPAEDPGAFFNALGYPILPDGTRGTSLAVIGVGDRFAVLADDFRDGHEAQGVPLQFIFQLTGTSVPSALVWPRVQGTWRGGDFWYSCQLPRITRDVIRYCADHPNTYFTSPLAGSSRIIQGAFSQGSHKGAYAWDFTADLGTPVYAARAGRVLVRISGSDETCPGGGCLGNRVILEHQDGTYANYLHFAKDTVVVGETGSWVERGELIALSGNTGVSNGPHLHWGHEFGGDPFDPSDDVAEPARFHVNLVTLRTLVPQTCFEPLDDDVIAPR